MFSYKKNNFGYFIKSDKIKGDFGPFGGIYCKNKYFGEFKEIEILEKKYPGYKYSFGFSEKRIFIISKNGIEKILDN